MQTYEQSGYLAERVLTGSPLELIRMLYEGALTAVDMAIEMLHSGDIMARGRAVTKAVNILGELRSSIRNGPEFACTIAELYGYMQNRLLEAHARKSEDHLREVSRLLKCLYDAWLGVMRQLTPVEQQAKTDWQATSLVPGNPYEMVSSPASARSWQV